MNEDFLRFIEENQNPSTVRLNSLIKAHDYKGIKNFLLFSKKIIIDFCKNGFLSYLIDIQERNNEVDSTISTFMCLLQAKDFNFFEILSENDFLEAMKYRNEYVISALLESAKFSENKNINIIEEISKRNDPYLLEGIISLGNLRCCYEDGVSLLKYCIDEDLDEILNNFYLFIDDFFLTSDDLLDARTYFILKHGSARKIPFILETAYQEAIRNEAKEVLKLPETSKEQEQIKKEIENCGFMDIDYHVDIVAPNARDFLDDKKLQDSYICSALIDSNNILTELPYLIMSDTNVLISYIVKMQVMPVGIGDAEGKGVFEEMVKKYFAAVEEFPSLFSADTSSDYCLPVKEINTSTEDGENEDKEEVKRRMKIVFYGMGVVYLKALYSRINFDFCYKIHVWMFNQLCNYTPSYRLLIQEALRIDRKEVMAILEESNKTKLEDIPMLVYDTLTAGTRKEFIELVRKGFRLEFDPTILPKCLEKPMNESKKALADFFDYIDKKPPESLMCFLARRSEVDEKTLLKVFKIRLMETIETFVDGTKDVSFVKKKFPKSDVDKMENTRKIITQCLKRWHRSNKEILKHFLKITIGSTSIQFLLVSKWTIFVVLKDIEHGTIYSNSCDNCTRVSTFNSEEEFESAVEKYYTLDDKMLYD